MDHHEYYEQYSLESGSLTNKPSSSKQAQNVENRDSVPLYQQIWAELSKLKDTKSSSRGMKWKIRRKVFCSFDLAGMALQKLLVAYVLTLSDKAASIRSIQVSQTIIVLSGSFILMISNFHGKAFFNIRLFVQIIPYDSILIDFYCDR